MEHCGTDCHPPVTNLRGELPIRLPTPSWNWSHQGKQHSQALDRAALHLHREKLERYHLQ